MSGLRDYDAITTNLKITMQKKQQSIFLKAMLKWRRLSKWNGNSKVGEWSQFLPFSPAGVWKLSNIPSFGKIKWLRKKVIKVTRWHKSDEIKKQKDIRDRGQNMTKL